MKLGVSIYTYDKTQEACIQMEIIRELRSKFFDEIIIVHTYNGNPQDYPKKYLEDELIYMDNPGHYQGASNMMDKGVEQLLKYDLDYIMINACDVRRIKPEALLNIIQNMKNSGKILGTCPWSFKGQNENTRRGAGLACDTLILDAKWEKKYKIFPLKRKEFYDKYIDFIRYVGKNNVVVEALLASKYISACSKLKMNSNSELGSIADNLIYFIKERIPTLISTTERNFDTPSLGLYTNHDLNIKKKILIENNLVLGPYSKAFIV